MRYEEYVRKILDDYTNHGNIEIDAFPDLDLYIDQAAVFMNKSLSIYAKEEQPEILTKAMINNYTKHRMLPRPENKKYSKEHLLMLTLVFYLKSAFPMNDIEKLMRPMVDNYSSEFEDKYDLTKIYNILCEKQVEEQNGLKQVVEDNMDHIKRSLEGSDMADDQLIEVFLLINEMIIKADAQRFVAQKLLDEYFVKTALEQKEKPKKEKKEKIPKAEPQRNKPRSKGRGRKIRIRETIPEEDLEVDDVLPEVVIVSERGGVEGE